ncbi:hypothetical protein BJV82DRAFT_147333 [Fennellomyces sp. T-0311]|nr:hypothetical protein BJV82DRAFT_147333 [Fennellomyces sp. T-0311]
MQNQQDRAPYGVLESYFPHRVNYAEAVSRPHEEATRRSDEFTPPGARWLASKKSMPSSPAPNRVLPQPQAMNHFPYQATAAMLPTPPMSVRQPNGRHKHTSDEDLESFEFPPLATHWPSLQVSACHQVKVLLCAPFLSLSRLTTCQIGGRGSGTLAPFRR